MANILIADTDQGIRQVIVDSLQDFGHSLYEVEDGGQVLDFIQKNAIQIVLADRELPGKDGLEVLQEIKRTRPQIPVVMILGMGDEDHEDMLDAGAFATLTKPFNVQEVRRVVREAVPLTIETAASLADEVPVEVPKPTLPWKKIAWSAGGAALAGALMAGGWFGFKAFKAVPLKIFSVPYANLSGIASDGQKLWTCDWFNQSFYRHSLDAILSMDKAFSKEEWHPSALAWDGKTFWSCSSWERKIARHKLEPGFPSDLEIASPAEEPSGLWFDGDGTFWMCDARGARILHCALEGNSIKVLESSASPGQRPIGVARDKKYLWTADSRSGMVYKHGTSQGFGVLEVYALPAEVQKEKLSCFTWDGKTFWVGTETGQRLYQIHPKLLKLVGTAE